MRIIDSQRRNTGDFDGSGQLEASLKSKIHTIPTINQMNPNRSTKLRTFRAFDYKFFVKEAVQIACIPYPSLFIRSEIVSLDVNVKNDTCIDC